jgi:hypothetical protein
MLMLEEASAQKKKKPKGGPFTAPSALSPPAKVAARSSSQNIKEKKFGCFEITEMESVKGMFLVFFPPWCRHEKHASGGRIAHKVFRTKNKPAKKLKREFVVKESIKSRERSARKKKPRCARMCVLVCVLVCM